jgi:hypothetical protein
MERRGGEGVGVDVDVECWMEWGLLVRGISQPGEHSSTAAGWDDSVRRPCKLGRCVLVDGRGCGMGC